VGGIPNEAGENLRPLLFQRDFEAFLLQGTAKADIAPGHCESRYRRGR